ncbi:MAG TPA: DUF1501 domain-containing protein [Planctomycetaceae bacterium]|jgi:uncharacterized protein (DUF1501 family)|nr:DUF1501 domain-containing protein [Planctomycetaceae bacterium]
MLQVFGRAARGSGEVTRRELLRAGMLAAGGLTLADLLRSEARATSKQARRAKHCILVFLNGGPSQLDTFDLKPEAPSGIRGPFRPIDTRVPGLQITEKLPRLAQLADKFTIARSFHHHLAAHNTGAAYALSGHSPGSDANIAPTAMDHPSYGAVVAKMFPSASAIPSFVLTPTWLFDMGFPTPSAGGGWLGRSYDPFAVVRNQMMSASPKWEGEFPLPEGMALPADLSAARVADRRDLLSRIDTRFKSEHHDAPLRTLDTHEQKSFELLLAPEARAAFDLRQEPANVRDRYGRSEMGQVLLLSRRMIEAGVRFVTANAVSDPPRNRLASYQIWDTHFEHFRLYDGYLMNELDQGLSALISDLDERGLLAETIVLVMGEFGRTPKIADVDGGGRDHWPNAYSVLWAGGGAPGGQIVGSTDRTAAFVKDRPLKPDDLSATLYEALGIPHDTRLADIGGRPHPISEGTSIRELLG